MKPKEPSAEPECICDDVRILGACPVHDPPTTDIASDALVAAWRFDLHRIADDEHEEVPVRDIRQVLNRIEALRAEVERLREVQAQLVRACEAVTRMSIVCPEDAESEVAQCREAILAAQEKEGNR